MDIAAEASAVAFAAFSELAEINNVEVDVIIDRSIDVVDAEGNVRLVAALVSVIKDSLPVWTSGDLLEADSGNVRLRQVIIDDGFIERIEASPA